jgi:uncharacterized protein
MIRLRAHTLLCLQGFRGMGYSREFVQNLSEIHQTLSRDQDTQVEVLDSPDAVCGACPHRQVSGCSLNGAQSEDDMHAQDHAVMALLGVQPGNRLSWREVLQRIQASVTGDSLPDICGRCRWLPLGYCKEGIDRLRTPSGEPGNSEQITLSDQPVRRPLP